MSIVYYEAGLLLRGHIRKFLNEAKFTHGGFDWIETKDWGTSTFAIKGESHIVNSIVNSIDHWSKQISSASQSQ
jgi:hypothetical protein